MPMFGRMLCLTHETQADMLDNKDTIFCWDVVTTSNLKTWEALNYIRVIEVQKEKETESLCLFQVSSLRERMLSCKTVNVHP